MLILSACAGSTWVTQDGLPTDKNTLTNALNRCDFEKRRKEALAYIEQLDSKTADDLIIDEHKVDDDPVIDKDTIDCMARKGFKLP